MDIRNQLVSEKHFALLPTPVIEMLASLGLTGPQIAIYMLHWSAGHIQGNWKSKMAISVIMKRLNISKRTVLRSYKGLVEKGLISRQSGPVGSYEIPVVEVLIPGAFHDTLLESPNRKKDAVATSAPAPAIPKETTPILNNAESLTAPSKPVCRWESIDDAVGIEALAERTVEARVGKPTEGSSIGTNDAHLQLDDTEEVGPWKANKTHLLSASGLESPENITYRKILPGYALKIRKAVESVVPAEKVLARWHQIMWSIEEGQLTSKPVPHAFHLAMMLLKRDIWRKPFGMPSDWSWSSNPAQIRGCHA